jgi:geranylgeranyl pyrophosphate synthase
LIFAEIFGRDIEDFEANKDVYFIAGMTEIVHNGSLICDDLEDNSLKRRGDLCTYRKFGIDYAVNAGCFMYFAPMTKLDEYVSDPAKQSQLWKIHA